MQACLLPRRCLGAPLEAVTSTVTMCDQAEDTAETCVPGLGTEREQAACPWGASRTALGSLRRSSDRGSLGGELLLCWQVVGALGVALVGLQSPSPVRSALGQATLLRPSLRSRAPGAELCQEGALRGSGRSHLWSWGRWV